MIWTESNWNRHQLFMMMMIIIFFFVCGFFLFSIWLSLDSDLCDTHVKQHMREIVWRPVRDTFSSPKRDDRPTEHNKTTNKQTKDNKTQNKKQKKKTKKKSEKNQKNKQRAKAKSRSRSWGEPTWKTTRSSCSLLSITCLSHKF